MVTNREIIDSIIEGYVEKYRLDASAHPIRLPDLLLRECEQEIQRVNDYYFYIVMPHKYLLLVELFFCFLDSLSCVNVNMNVSEQVILLTT